MFLRSSRQQRSRTTADRIVAAAREVLATTPFDEVSVAQLAAAARVSVGGFYARFPSKGSLALHLLAVETLPETERRVTAALAAAGPAVREVFRAYLRTTASAFRQHGELLRSVSAVVRSEPDAELRRRVRTLNDRLHQQLCAALLARRARVRRRDPELAVNVAILAATAALREAVLFGQPVSSLVRVSDETLVDQLSRQASAYLGEASPPRASRARTLRKDTR